MCLVGVDLRASQTQRPQINRRAVQLIEDESWLATVAARAKRLDALEDVRQLSIELLTAFLLLRIGDRNITHETGCNYKLCSVTLVLFKGTIGQAETPHLIKPVLAGGFRRRLIAVG
jgi:hypothetical protein